MEALTSQHGLLLLGSANETADAVNHLTLGLHLLVFSFFRQDHDWEERTRDQDSVVRAFGRRSRGCRFESRMWFIIINIYIIITILVTVQS